MEEIWKDIKGYENKYQISNLGNVKSLVGNHKMLKPKIDRGYKRVGLSMDNKSKLFRVHRLVAEAFIPNPNNYPMVNHIDRDKINNVDSNLEWCTALYNVTHKLDSLAKDKQLFNCLCDDCKEIILELGLRAQISE